MLLSTSFVPIREIVSDVPRSSFSEDELNQAAELILQAEGTINPLVLRQTSLESYEVVDGYFEYYAAARAREIDPRKGEMIGAFILEAGSEKVIKEQIKVLRKREFFNNDEKQVAETKVKTSSNEAIQLESLLPKIENLIDKKFELTSKTIRQHLDESVKRIESILNQQKEIAKKEGNQTQDGVSNYAKMTVPQLKVIAAERNIEGRSKMKKEQLVAALKKADASQK
ncbi:MAG: Rho termination factor N-terminal domain-containing protein [Cyanobacteriota bacterium]